MRAQRQRVAGDVAHLRIAGLVVVVAGVVAALERRKAIGSLVGIAAAGPEMFAEHAAGVRGHDLRVVAAGRGVQRCARGGAGARDDVDDAAYGIGAVEAGARALDDLDALDRFGLDILERRAADGARD